MKKDIFKIYSVKWDGEKSAEEVVLEHIETGNKTILKSISHCNQALLKKIEGMKKKCEVIDVVGKKPVKEYFCKTYNQALEDIKKLL